MDADPAIAKAAADDSAAQVQHTTDDAAAATETAAATPLPIPSPSSSSSTDVQPTPTAADTETATATAAESSNGHASDQVTNAAVSGTEQTAADQTSSSAAVEPSATEQLQPSEIEQATVKEETEPLMPTDTADSTMVDDATATTAAVEQSGERDAAAAVDANGVVDDSGAAAMEDDAAAAAGAVEEEGDADVDAEADVEGVPAAAASESASTSQSSSSLEDRVRAICEEILSREDPTTLSKKSITRMVRDQIGKKETKRNKDMIARVAKEVAEKRMRELHGSEEAQEGAEGEGEAAAVEADEAVDEAAAQAQPALAPIGDVEEEDEEDVPRKKKRKRGRKGSDDDEDYSDRVPKKTKKKDAGKKGKLKKSSAAAVASSSSSSTIYVTLPLPRSASDIYARQLRNQLQLENPELSKSDAMRLALERWRELAEDEKTDWDAQAQKEKSDYKEKLHELKESDPEAYEEQKRGEEAAESGKKVKVRRPEYEDDPEDGHDPSDEDEEMTPAAPLSYFDSIVQSLKVKRQTKSKYDEKIQKERDAGFVWEMEQAAKHDIAAAEKKEPQVHKLQLLPDVQSALSKPLVAKRLLDDYGLLNTLNLWLTPSPIDGSLPNVRIRTVLYQLLDTLPITETHLTNSNGLGKRIMKLWRDEEETDSNKRLLESLIQKWMRPMLGLSTDFKHSLAEVENQRSKEILRRKIQLDSQPKGPSYATVRTRLPEPARFDYAFRPQADVDREAQEEEAREAANAAKREPESRRTLINKRLDKMKKGAAGGVAAGTKAAKPRFKVDITGRASNM